MKFVLWSLSPVASPVRGDLRGTRCWSFYSQKSTQTIEIEQEPVFDHLFGTYLTQLANPYFLSFFPDSRPIYGWFFREAEYISVVTAENNYIFVSVFWQPLILQLIGELLFISSNPLHINNLISGFEPFSHPISVKRQ